MIISLDEETLFAKPLHDEIPEKIRDTKGIPKGKKHMVFTARPYLTSH